jgi:hypothetical protein
LNYRVRDEKDEKYWIIREIQKMKKKCNQITEFDSKYTAHWFLKAIWQIYQLRKVKVLILKKVSSSRLKLVEFFSITLVYKNSWTFWTEGGTWTINKKFWRVSKLICLFLNLLHGFINVIVFLNSNKSFQTLGSLKFFRDKPNSLKDSKTYFGNKTEN